MEKYYEQDKNINLCAARAYYVPFEKGQAVSYDRADSARFITLNGIWKIKAYETVLDAENFLNEACDKEIPVPSCVQYFGLDWFQYTNCYYPFPFAGTKIPNKNPAYHYTRTVSVTKNTDEKIYLVTEGVDSCFYLYVNGAFVGFSQISHKVGEFDITPFVKQGENKIDMLVVKWCMGSYLEDQDKWRFTGIFRDIYLLRRPKNHLRDYKIDTDIDGDDGVVTFTPRDTLQTSVTLNGETQETNGEPLVFRIQNAKLWSAETPYLYPMDIECNGEVIFQRVGIRTSKVENGLYLFNGKPIKLYGVNRHDFHPEKGAAVSLADMKRDLTLMKELNVNAIRTSHYPSSPLLYELADEMGFYVMSESDVESHGCQAAWNEKNEWTKDIGIIAEDERYYDAILEREVFNVENHKNHACVVIWSMGNESGWGENLIKIAHVMHGWDSRPLHYESENNYFPGKYSKEDYASWELDMHSRMYASVPWLKDVFLKDESDTRPMVYCEYAHAMGNSPGDLKGYWEVIEAHDRLMGAFIWEWADHGVSYGGKTERYGGDFGEALNDNNFCIDGIVTADRNCKAGTYSMQYFYQPLQFTKDGDTLCVKNKNFFAPMVGTLKVQDKNGEHSFEMCIAPRECIKLPCAGESTVYTEFIKRGETEPCAHQQFYVNAYLPRAFKEKQVQITENMRYVYVTAGDNEYTLDKTSGEIIDVKVDGESLGGVAFNVWRAPLDNDRNIRKLWEWRLLHLARPDALRVCVNGNQVQVDIGVGYARSIYLVEAKLTYTFHGDGVEISISYNTEKKHGYEYYAYLPRIGWKMKLDKRFDKVKYLAYGNGETYADMYDHAVKAEYSAKVQDEYFPYAKPQESGSHYLPEYAEVTDGKYTVRAEGMRSFSAIGYSAETLMQAKHHDELPESDGTYFCVDYYMTGLGTGSCGPQVQPPYQTPEEGEGSIRLYFEKKK